ncbi:MAG TPA: hypothetical protein PLC54_04355 [Spirochaetales bacterium]|nr:hypothetical protein [Spirochaetales bacterium]
MQAIDKLKSDMDDWTRRAGSVPGQRDLDSLRALFFRAMGPVPQETLAGAYTNFLSMYGADGPEGRTRALAWLGGIGSLLLMDYDGTPFSREEWSEIKDLLTLDAGEIDIDVLSYVLSQVMEHGAL